MAPPGQLPVATPSERVLGYIAGGLSSDRPTGSPWAGASAAKTTSLAIAGGNPHGTRNRSALEAKHADSPSLTHQFQGEIRANSPGNLRPSRPAPRKAVRPCGIRAVAIGTIGRVHLRARRLRPVSAVAVPSDRARPRILGSAPMRSFLDAKGLWTPGRTIPGVIGSSASPSLPTTATGAVRALRRSRESRRGPEDGRIAVAVHRRAPAGPPPAPTSRGANDRAVPERCLPCRYLQNETADST